MKVSEPIATYHTPNLQGLKNKLISSIDATNDEEKLQECLEVLYRDSIPCVFTEEELDEEIRLSEASGIATDEEVAAMYAKWGLYK
jgi:hypothetical protein